jgi:hypothetical protein
VLGEREVQQARDAAEAAVAEAVEFAEASPEPALDTMYENLYAVSDPGGWYAVDERSPEPHRGAREEQMPDAARELAEAGAAYAGQPEGPRPNPAQVGDAQDGVESRVGAEPEVGDEPEETLATESGDDGDAPTERAINTEEGEA